MELELKQIAISDAGKIAKWKSDPDLSVSIMSSSASISENEAQDWIKKNTSDPNQRLNGIYNSKTLVGITRLMFIDFETKIAEFGIYIGDTEYQGMGIGSKALQLTINQAFEQLNLQKIFLKVNETNTPAIRLYKKFNFHAEGTLKEHYFNVKTKTFEDIIYMALFNPIQL